MFVLGLIDQSIINDRHVIPTQRATAVQNSVASIKQKCLAASNVSRNLLLELYFDHSIAFLPLGMILP